MTDSFKEGGGQSTKSSADKVIAVLLAFRNAPDGLRLTDVSRALDLHPSTASRTLATLADSHLLRRDEASQKYYIGPALVALGAIGSNHNDLRRLVRSQLIEIRDVTEETVTLQVGFGTSRFCAEMIPGLHDLRRVATVGTVVAIHRGSSGRAIIAFLDDAELAPVLANAGTDPTLAGGVELLIKRLGVVRAQGFSISVEEVVPQIIGLSFPVFDHTAKVQAAITISFPMFRHTESAVREMASELMPLAEAASRAAGYTGTWRWTGADAASVQGARE